MTRYERQLAVCGGAFLLWLGGPAIQSDRLGLSSCLLSCLHAQTPGLASPASPSLTLLLGLASGLFLALALGELWLAQSRSPDSQAQTWTWLQVFHATSVALVAFLDPGLRWLPWILFAFGQAAWLGCTPLAWASWPLRLGLFGLPILLFGMVSTITSPSGQSLVVAVLSLPAWLVTLQKNRRALSLRGWMTPTPDLGAAVLCTLSIVALCLLPHRSEALLLWLSVWCAGCLMRLTAGKKQMQATLAELKKALDELRDRNREYDAIRQQDQLQALLFRNASHELRTLLHGLLGFLRLLHQPQSASTPADQQRLHARCLHLAEMLQEEIQGLLALTQSRPGVLQKNCQRFPLEQLARSIEQWALGLQGRYPETGFELRRLWSVDEASFIQDYPKVAHVARHILSNAFACGKPGQANQVVCALSVRKDLLSLEISDKGTGLPRERMPQIVAALHPKPEDSILAADAEVFGLHLVGRLLQVIDAEVVVHTEEGLGSKFTVLCPQQTLSSWSEPQEDLLPQASIPREKLVGLTPTSSSSSSSFQTADLGAQILVIDDNQINCELIREMLILQGYRVQIARSGRSGLAQMQRDRPDLVLLDMMMPDLSGADVIRGKQNDPQLRDIPVILVTARASDDERIFGLELGADDYLAKPIIQQELILRVRNLLARMRMTRILARAEERDKLAHLGELLTDCSTEVQSIYGEALEQSKVQQQARRALLALPPLAPVWQEFFHAWLDQDQRDTPEDLTALPLPHESAAVGLYRELRLFLAPTPLSMERKQELWQHACQEKQELLERVVSLLQLIEAYRRLRQRSARARDILDNLLTVHVQTDDQQISAVGELFEHAAQLFHMRLKRVGGRVELQIEPTWVAISPSSLMQITLNLFAYACDHLEELLDQDKWLRIQTERRGDLLLIRLVLGGPLLAPEDMGRLFEEQTGGMERRRRSLALSRRLAQAAYGRLGFARAEALTTLDLELQLVPTPSPPAASS